MGGACSRVPRVWVVAACEGMVSLFEKQADGHVVPMAYGDGTIFPSMAAFQTTLTKADADRTLEKLIIVGSGNDIAWIHAALPVSVTRHIAAEIEYPLVTSWFRETPQLYGLTHALEHLLN